MMKENCAELNTKSAKSCTEVVRGKVEESKWLRWPVLAGLFFLMAQERMITPLLVSLWELLLEPLDTTWLIIALYLLAVVGGYMVWLRHDAYIPKSVVGWVALALGVYGYYRVCSPAFVFLPLGGPLAHADVLTLPLWGLVLSKARDRCRRRKATEASEATACAIMRDEAIRRIEEDALGFSSLADSLLDNLKAMSQLEHSFSVGVVASWGKGKTSFLNLLLEKAKGQGAITLVFNPRASKRLECIQEDFFRMFAQAVSPYYVGLRLLLVRYVKGLGLLGHGSWGQHLADLLEGYWAQPADIEEVNRAIDNIGRRIYVVIDDLDRLTAEEILEVFKLIDRNGRFRNTIFLSAYDKAYVGQVLKQHLGHGHCYTYTDKYFAMELTLPEPTIDVLSRFVTGYLEEFVQDGAFVSREQVLKAWKQVKGEILPHLGSIRHAKRFCNLLLSTYPKVQDDVHFEDFCLLTLLRYKDLPVYNALSLRRFVDACAESWPLLGFDDKQLKQLPKLAIWEGAEGLIRQLFPSEEPTSPRSWPDTYNRVRVAESFDRYFGRVVEGGLYNEELLTLLQKRSSTEIRAQVERWDDRQQTKRLEQFIRYQLEVEVTTKAELIRLLSLLAHAYVATNRDGGLGAVWVSMFGSLRGRAKFFQNKQYNEDDYQKAVDEAWQSAMEQYPLEMGYVCLLAIRKSSVLNVPLEAPFTDKELRRRIAICLERYCEQRGAEGRKDEEAFALVWYYGGDDLNVIEKVLLPLLRLIKKHPNEFVNRLIKRVHHVELPNENEVHLIHRLEAERVIIRLVQNTAPDDSEEASKLVTICRVFYERHARGYICRLTFPREMTEKEYMQVDALYEAMQRAGYITAPAPNAVE